MTGQRTAVMDRSTETYHELLLDLAEALQAGLQLEMVVGRRLGNGRHDGDPVALWADVVRRRYAGDVDVFKGVSSQLFQLTQCRPFENRD